MLHIQSELKQGKTIPEICESLGIKYTEKEGKVILTYDQIESPKANPIVRECRGLILYNSDYSVACGPFERFFNYGESGADVLPDNLSGCLVLPKLDGTMANLWFDRVAGRWVVSTRSMINAEGPVNNVADQSFAELFWNTFLFKAHDFEQFLAANHNKTFTFELTSPLNRIVTPYKEANVTLLTARNNDTLEEISHGQLIRMAISLGVDVVHPVKMSDWKQLLTMQGLAATDEGFVVVKESKEGSHKRVKVKNPAYLAIHRLVSSISERAFLELIQQGGQDEYLTYYPEYQEHINKLITGLRKVEETIKNDWLDLYQIEDRKAFALEAVKRKFPSLLFGLRDGKITKLSTDLILLRSEKLLEMIHHVE